MAIEVPRALRSNIKAPKALNGVESGEGCRKRILDLLVTNISGRQKDAIFSNFLIFGFWSVEGH